MPLGSDENQRRRLTTRTEQVEGGLRSLVGWVVRSLVAKAKVKVEAIINGIYKTRRSCLITSFEWTELGQMCNKKIPFG